MENQDNAPNDAPIGGPNTTENHPEETQPPNISDPSLQEPSQAPQNIWKDIPARVKVLFFIIFLILCAFGAFGLYSFTMNKQTVATPSNSVPTVSANHTYGIGN